MGSSHSSSFSSCYSFSRREDWKHNIILIEPIHASLSSFHHYYPYILDAPYLVSIIILILYLKLHHPFQQYKDHYILFTHVFYWANHPKWPMILFEFRKSKHVWCHGHGYSLCLIWSGMMYIKLRLVPTLSFIVRRVLGFLVADNRMSDRLLIAWYASTISHYSRIYLTLSDHTSLVSGMITRLWHSMIRISFLDDKQ